MWLHYSEYLYEMRLIVIVTICQGHAEWERSDPEWSGVTPEWKGFDNKMGTTLASAHMLCLDCHDLAKWLS